MKPRAQSTRLLSITRSKAKMYEYSVPLEDHISIPRNPAHLFPVSIALLGDVAADMSRRLSNQEAQEFSEAIKELQFSALFFDSYIQAKLDGALDGYLTLLAAATHYLCDLPGSASAILNRNPLRETDGADSELCRFLYWILKSNFQEDFTFSRSIFRRDFTLLKSTVREFFAGSGSEEVIELLAREIRAQVYDLGSPRELLLTDVCFSVLKLKIQYSTKKLLPQYTNTPLATWAPVIANPNFMRELWPSQRLLGECGVFQGTSAIVQMPTSAGKSKSIEVVIRSAFLSGRTKTCVVVAPFRALCREITETLGKAFRGEPVSVNELSDIFQKDFDADSLTQNNTCQILSVTPEKLVYVLRQTPELAGQIGLLVLDEGHQFDSGTRGVTYELLITSLKSLLPVGVQTILISAVISNAEAISEWLLGSADSVVKDNGLIPTYRTVGFSSFTSPQGRSSAHGFIYYVQPKNIREEDFWVPRVIEAQTLQKRGRERKERVFPRKDDGKTVAAHLGIKLVTNGSVAVFCGVKSTAATLTEEIIEAFDRGYEAEKPSTHADENELLKISYLYEKNFGPDSIECRGAKYGILAHHAGIPHGLRLATEHSMRLGYGKFVVCTSTLAQGVNLPIRYLIFTSIYQAGERLRVRDFHNLIGRAGRSGLQTEGTIIFADPEVYDKKSHRKESWRFNSVVELFDASRSEPCASSLLKIFDPLNNANKSLNLVGLDILSVIEKHYANESSLNTLVADVVRQFSGNNFEEKSLRLQLRHKLKITSTIESYLIAALISVTADAREAASIEIAKRTLAYHLAGAEQKVMLEKLFAVISRNIDGKVPSEDKRSSYSRTLLGLAEMLEVDSWVQANLNDIIGSSEGNDDDAIYSLLYPLIDKFIEGDTLKKISPDTQRTTLALMWIQGKSYQEIHAHLLENGAWLQAGSQRRKVLMSHVVDACDGELAFDGMLVLGAIAEILEGNSELLDTTIPNSVRMLQKRIKYGLPDSLSVRLYELGFADRVISQELKEFLSDKSVPNNYMLIQEFNRNADALSGIFDQYPAYFSDVLGKYMS